MKLGPRFLKLTDEAKTHVKNLSSAEIKQKFDNKENFYLIDVREDYEWQHGHIPSAMHLSKGKIESKIEHIIPDTQADIVVYCRGGGRGALVADNLQKMGYNNVKNMAGGIRAWHDAGYPCGDVLEE